MAETNARELTTDDALDGMVAVFAPWGGVPDMDEFDGNDDEIDTLRSLCEQVVDLLERTGRTVPAAGRDGDDAA